MLSVFGGFAFVIYDSYVRYAAYGEVVGRKVQLAPPWNGVVSALHVRVGDAVQQGEVRSSTLKASQCVIAWRKSKTRSTSNEPASVRNSHV